MSARPVGRPFVKGQSGNPGGRPRIVGELRDLARAHAPAAIQELARLALKAKATIQHGSRLKTHTGSGLFPCVLRRQLLQQRLRFLQIARIETRREPPVNRSEQSARSLNLALVAPRGVRGSWRRRAFKSGDVPRRSTRR
jgi:Family of unknown function (DUF5681)